MKNILYVNTHAFAGGAAAVIQRLSAVMQARGMNTTMLTGSPGQGQPATLKATRDTGLHAWTIWRGQLDYGFQKSHSLLHSSFFRHADIVHLHNLHGGYFNIWSLPLLSAHKPTVWTLHDMQPLTGHCAHSQDCKRWLPDIGCNHCPHLETYPHLWRDTAHQLWRDKQIIFTHSSMYLITPSAWLQHLVEKSLLKEQPLVCIPNGVDTTIYHPQNKSEMRRILGLPQHALLVGGCADGGMANPWKGGTYVLETILKLKKIFPSLQFLNIGVKNIPKEFQGADWVQHIPYIQEPTQLARLYSALDLLLYPTLADNHPLVCIESLCCGTPIVGFSTGGVPEIVRDGLDGLLVSTHDGTALTKAAVTLLQDTYLREIMGKEAAISAAQRFNLDLFARRYQKVYEAVLHMPRSLEKSRLPLNRVPVLVKSPTFMRQEWNKYSHPSLQQQIELLFHSIIGAICTSLATVAGWPLQMAYLLRTLYRHYRRC